MVSQQQHKHHNGHYRRKRKRRREAPLAERGWILFLVLRVLHENSTHGYQLVDELESRGYVEQGRFETGSIYVILKRLEKKGFLSSKKGKTESGKIRRVYSVTEKGEIALQEGLEFIMKRKKVHDELADYYLKEFSEKKANSLERKD